MPPIVITGAAGFIGMHVAERLLRDGAEVIGLDNVNAYYDPRLKRERIARLGNSSGFSFIEADVADRLAVDAAFARARPEIVVHLAAQAGVRYSLENPDAYIQSNLVGFANILEACRAQLPRHLIYASSSSVYGGNTKVPFATTDSVDAPVSLYAATKKANELMAHAYSHLYGIPTTGLRFFTVYGPWGRPDMAYFSFTRKILAGEEIPVFNNGNLSRDFTYIDDIVESIVRVLGKPPSASPLAGGSVAARVFNIGASSPTPLMEFISELERALGVPAKLAFQPMQPGDVLSTFADVSDLERVTGYRPTTSLADGLEQFVRWYRGHFR